MIESYDRDRFLEIREQLNCSPLQAFKEDYDLLISFLLRFVKMKDSENLDNERIMSVHVNAFKFLSSAYGIPADLIDIATGKPERKPASEYFTVAQLAMVVNVTSDELFQILLDCSYVCGQDGVYSVTASGNDLGGINCSVDCDEYCVFFPRSLIEDEGILDGLNELQDRRLKQVSATFGDCNKNPPQPPTEQAKNSNPENPANKDKEKATKDKGKQSGGWEPPEVGEPPF